MKKNFNKLELQKMIERYLAGKATVEEEAFIYAYYEHLGNRKSLAGQFSAAEKQELEQDMRAVIMHQIDAPAKKRIRMFAVKMTAAAAVLIFIAAGTYYLYRKQSPESVPVAGMGSHDIAPGGNKAHLTLADGSTIVLDTAGIGLVARQGTARINKAGQGEIVYEASAQSADKMNVAPAYNIITTPRGGEYQVTLPDGTRVWLNAASSLKFPVSFTEKERLVELTGEAYFEVASLYLTGQVKSKMPFRVKSNRQVVEVLGTHFNISSYADEPDVKTTLLEGRIKVSAARPGTQNPETVILQPGQQANVHDVIRVSTVDAAQAIDWKNGYFIFRNENLDGIMRKIARWYNVDVEYAPGVSKKAFGGKISRRRSVSEVFKMLELTGSVHFQIEGNKIIVMP